MTTLREAAQARSAGYPSLAARPSERRMSEDPTASRRGAVRVDIKPGDLREIERNGMTVVRVGGMASVTGQPYEMWDMFGPYDEIVARGVFTEALASDPVAVRVRHRSGEYRNCEITGTRLQHAGSTALLVLHTRDVTA